MPRPPQRSLSCLSGFEALCDVFEHPCFYSVRLLASRQTPKLEDHSWLDVHDFLFNIFAANRHIWRPTPPSAIQGTRHAVVTGTQGWQDSYMELNTKTQSSKLVNTQKNKSKTKSVQIVRSSAMLKLVQTRMAYSEAESSVIDMRTRMDYSEDESSVSNIGFVKLAVLLEDNSKTIKFLQDNGLIPDDSI